MFGFLDAAGTVFDCSPRLFRQNSHCMFDWPEQIHTSPTATFLKAMVFLPLIVSVYPVPGFCLLRVADHLPSLSAVAGARVFDTSVFVSRSSSTAISSPGVAVPQTT